MRGRGESRGPPRTRPSPDCGRSPARARPRTALACRGRRAGARRASGRSPRPERGPPARSALIARPRSVVDATDSSRIRKVDRIRDTDGLFLLDGETRFRLRVRRVSQTPVGAHEHGVDRAGLALQRLGPLQPVQSFFGVTPGEQQPTNPESSHRVSRVELGRTPVERERPVRLVDLLEKLAPPRRTEARSRPTQKPLAPPERWLFERRRLEARGRAGIASGTPPARAQSRARRPRQPRREGCEPDTRHRARPRPRQTSGSLAPRRCALRSSPRLAAPWRPRSTSGRTQPARRPSTAPQGERRTATRSRRTRWRVSSGLRAEARREAGGALSSPRYSIGGTVPQTKKGGPRGPALRKSLRDF